MRGPSRASEREPLMAWKASATLTSTVTTGITPKRPITNKDASAQFTAALDALPDLLIGSGPWDIELVGNGLSYPTSKVTMTVSYDSTDDPGQSWEAKGPVNNAAQATELIAVPPVSGD